MLKDFQYKFIAARKRYDMAEEQLGEAWSDLHEAQRKVADAQKELDDATDACIALTNLAPKTLARLLAEGHAQADELSRELIPDNLKSRYQITFEDEDFAFAVWRDDEFCLFGDTADDIRAQADAIK